MAHSAIPTAFDFIIVGAGSAGCVIANRLSADPAVSVCLIEGGAKDNTPRIHVPAGTVTLYTSKTYAYHFESVPQRHLNNRKIPVPRGRMLGGSSSMNSMIYIRGDRSDYDDWRDMGCPGWGYDDVLPYFKKSEADQLGLDPAYHGKSGELDVTRPRDPNSVSRLFVDAAAEAGQTRSGDFNGAELEGVGVYNVTQRNGQRLSSYRAFVAPVRNRTNLHVLTDAEVMTLTMDGTRVTGVALKTISGNKTLTARREVILSAGALGSPQLLMASGIGDADELTRAGVTIRHHLPSVGKHLQDHLDALVSFRSDSGKGLAISASTIAPVLASPFKYLLQRKGWWTTNYVESGGFARTKYANAVPDIQFHFIPFLRLPGGKLFEWGHGFGIHTCLLQPKSRGAVALAADGSGRNLAIDFNFLDREEDARVLVEGLRTARAILNAPAFDILRGKEAAPGVDKQSDEALLDYIRQFASTVFHPSGTCRMGSDEDAVVTPDLKVRGLQGLRVADASIMPKLVSGNTNAPSIMIGEKAAAMILAA
ncbi:GMC family oxidoreductase [Acidisoma silvae]|uniref:GMC family oxidoreductase N-terminal domain-containing protein n=1 Tax=Acidisoma silvae TaxID=2802396 RepID=A0A964E0T3_9PROT|nr:GMC family oxidoreductase N-terminal domain-containing protein [Acidisoma silvae]MCB8877068.1 GMC family oxidoreductase N-terminal domain-containing protein [Acidisoma silvae]